jgi:sugar-specific transcriptional regulator TrmB
MVGSDSNIAQLKSILRGELGWTQYQAAAYCALVVGGEMQACDVELEADIPNSRVYGVLNKLDDQGRIRQTGMRPKTYDAIHPRDVINDEVNQYRQKSETAKSHLEQAWETERVAGDGSDGTWALNSSRGLINQARSQIEQAENSVRVVDKNLRWMSRDDRETLANLSDEDVDVKVIGSDDAKTTERLADDGVNAYQHEKIVRNFYVIDEQQVIARVARDGTGIAFTDESMATIYIQDFEETLEEATEVIPIA